MSIRYHLEKSSSVTNIPNTTLKQSSNVTNDTVAVITTTLNGTTPDDPGNGSATIQTSKTQAPTVNETLTPNNNNTRRKRQVPNSETNGTAVEKKLKESVANTSSTLVIGTERSPNNDSTGSAATTSNVTLQNSSSDSPKNSSTVGATNTTKIVPNNVTTVMPLDNSTGKITKESGTPAVNSTRYTTDDNSTVKKKSCTTAHIKFLVYVLIPESNSNRTTSSNDTGSSNGTSSVNEFKINNMHGSKSAKRDSGRRKRQIDDESADKSTLSDKAGENKSTVASTLSVAPITQYQNNSAANDSTSNQNTTKIPVTNSETTTATKENRTESDIAPEVVMALTWPKPPPSK